MMLCDLTDADVLLLYQGSDSEAREGWNIILMNRFMKLIDHFDDQNTDAGELYAYVEKRCADLTTDKAVNDG